VILKTIFNISELLVKQGLPVAGGLVVALESAADIVPTLFSRLSTVRRTDRDRTRGTGMGLSLVRGLVEAMGGRVWYEPGAGGGASFRFTLPMPHRHRSAG